MTFLDHYHVLAAYIQLRANDTLSICQAYNEFEPSADVDTHALGKLLINCWSAEYALRITPVVNDEQYLQSSLHWTFPQGYYSVLFSSRAFLLVTGKSISNEENISRAIGSLVNRGYYPPAIGFYAFGLPGKYMTRRLPATVPLLGEFVNTTRDKRVKTLARSIQTNPKTALRHPKTGAILEELSPEQYREVCKQVGFTTIFNLMSRLRISSTNREIEQYVDGTIDVRAFHASLQNIVAYINGVHEQYIIKAIGTEAYSAIVWAAPSYLRESFVRERMYSFATFNQSINCSDHA